MEKKKTIVLVSALLLIASANLWAGAGGEDVYVPPPQQNQSGGAIAKTQQFSVAVRAFQTSGGLSQDEGNAITDIFISELVSTGVIVVDRNSFDSIIAEMTFQASDWSDNNNLARLGRAVNANYIIQGTVTSLGGRIVITVRVLDISRVQFLASSSLPLTNMNEIFDKMNPFVVNLVLNLSANLSTYTVGNIGPSGGYVFYDKGSYSDGWRYLEAAPASAEFAATTLSTSSDTLRAMNVNGNTGWRLPTVDELLIMFGTLKQKELGSFQDANYWSSTYVTRWSGSSSYLVYYVINMQNGSRNEGGGRGLLLVRAVRQF